MSYIQKDTGIPDFTKGVISLWFRVPQESIDKCLTKTLATPLASASTSPLYGIIPFVVFGSQTMRLVTDRIVTGGSYMDGAVSFKTYYEAIDETDGGEYFDPSVIGLALNADRNAGSLSSLSVYGSLQTSAPGTIEGLPLIDSGEPTFISAGSAKYVSGQTVTWSYAQESGPQAYGFSIDVDKSNFADTWHHILVSCDLSHTVSGTSDSTIITGGNFIWVALDDVNYNQDSLTNWIEGSDDNAVCSDAILKAQGQPTPPYPLPLLGSIPIIADLTANVNGSTEAPTTDKPATCTVPGAPIPASAGPLGLPATGKFIDNIYKVELAEFLLFTDATLDTSEEKNRRLFIAPDKNGILRPVNPSPITIPVSILAVGDPTTWEPGADWPAFVGQFDPSSVPTSNRILGRADVDFTKSSFNWMGGRNLGTAKGKFAKTGKIKAYFPDPKLES
jgi:hypothetical protein